MLTVEDIMTADPCYVEPDTALGDAIDLMKGNRCRQLPVVSRRGEIVGIITDRDVRLAMNSPFVLHERADDITLLENVPVEACMTPDPLTIDVNAPVALATEMLREYKFGALPVMRGRKLVGILTVSDLLRSYATLLEKLEDD